MKIAVVAFAIVLAFTGPSDARGSRGSSGGGHAGSYHPRVSHAPSGRESHSTTHVSGYTTKRGTVVKPYDRTRPDHTKANNWSTKGNVNLENGKPGSKRP